MKVTLDISSTFLCCFLNGVQASDDGGLQMVSYSIDTDDLRDGKVIKLPRDEEGQR